MPNLSTIFVGIQGINFKRQVKPLWQEFCNFSSQISCYAHTIFHCRQIQILV